MKQDVLNDLQWQSAKASMFTATKESELTTMIPPAGWATSRTSCSTMLVILTPMEEIPVYDRFYAGGLKTIRGFREGSIGVYGEDRDPGGMVMLVCQNEIRWPLWNNLRGAIFVDFGNVWRERRDVKSSDLRLGFGTGLRFALPIGRIYLDLAWPQKSPEPIRDTQYYIGIGQVF